MLQVVIGNRCLLYVLEAKGFLKVLHQLGKIPFFKLRFKFPIFYRQFVVFYRSSPISCGAFLWVNVLEEILTPMVVISQRLWVAANDPQHIFKPRLGFCCIS
jgi:hypothetical protein